MTREPFITVSVANCEGRRKKRGGGHEKRGKREMKGKARREGRREEREGVRREGGHEKRTGKEPGRKNKRFGVSNELLCF